MPWLQQSALHGDRLDSEECLAVRLLRDSVLPLARLAALTRHIPRLTVAVVDPIDVIFLSTLASELFWLGFLLGTFVPGSD